MVMRGMPLDSLTILVSGVSGLIGSHVCRELVASGANIIALRRETSNLSRCQDYIDKIIWINTNNAHWITQCLRYKPDRIVHCAWSGIDSNQRNDWHIQLSNFSLFQGLLEIALQSPLKQFIALGSQAEYGSIDGRIDESTECLPNTAYGSVKIACLSLLQSFSRLTSIPFVWLRLFSVYGPDEAQTWFISNVIQQIKNGISPELTLCEQKYDYLSVWDIAKAINIVLQRSEYQGVFNLGSNSSIPLSEIVSFIQSQISPSMSIKFGNIPYRPNQSMHIEGDSSLFYKTYNFEPQLSIFDAIKLSLNVSQ